MTTSAHQRRDAERNHEAIVTAAIAVLADTPEATMAEIAAASGTGRSTLYRHFPDREALIAAISTRVVDDAGAIIDRRLADSSGDLPADVLVDIVTQLAALGDRYRFLLNHNAPKGGPPKGRRRGIAIRNFVAEAQAAGTLRDDVDTEWLTQAIEHMIGAAAKYEFPDPESRRTAIDAIVRSMLTPVEPSAAARRGPRPAATPL